MISRFRWYGCRCRFSRCPLVPGFHQFVHQGSGRGAAYRHSPLADGQGQSQRDVGPAAVVDGDNAIPVLEVFMAGQFDLLQE